MAHLLCLVTLTLEVGGAVPNSRPVLPVEAAAVAGTVLGLVAAEGFLGKETLAAPPGEAKVVVAAGAEALVGKAVRPEAVLEAPAWQTITEQEAT